MTSVKKSDRSGRLTGISRQGRSGPYIDPMKMLPTLLLLAASATAAAQNAPTRGELLYTTHCVACHDQQVHWRDRRQATDWATLKSWVRRWQLEVGLNWNEADVAEVAGYLNDTFYKLQQTSERRS